MDQVTAMLSRFTTVERVPGKRNLLKVAGQTLEIHGELKGRETFFLETTVAGGDGALLASDATWWGLWFKHKEELLVLPRLYLVELTQQSRFPVKASWTVVANKVWSASGVSVPYEHLREQATLVWR